MPDSPFDEYLDLVEAARELGVTRFVFPSTIAVYGPGLPDPTPDDARSYPSSTFSI